MKPRRALTPYRALHEIADLLGWDGCASVLGKSESLVRKWADPDTEREISYQAAIRLDAAYMRAGGKSAPLFECYAARLDLSADEDEDHAGTMEAVSAAAKEAGEAVAAAIDCLGRTNDLAARNRAVIETEESIGALQRLRQRLKRSG